MKNLNTLKDLEQLMQKTFFLAIKMGNLNDIVTRYLKELKSQPELYRPEYLEKALHDIAASYCRSGHNNFRNDGLNLFFVPTYGMPGNGFDKKTLKNIIQVT